MIRYRELSYQLGLLVALMIALSGIASGLPKPHRQGQTQAKPQIQNVYVAYRTVNTGSDNMAFPYDSTDVVVKAIVVAWVNGQLRAYTDLGESGWTDGSTWHVYGVQGPGIDEWEWPEYEWLSDPPRNLNTVYQWDTAKWGTPGFSWAIVWHQCTAWNGGYDRKYDYNSLFVPSWSGWGTSNSGTTLGVGLARYIVTVAYGTQPPKTSASQETATRIAVRSGNNFGIAGGDDDSIRRLKYLRWVFSYLGEPYEWGGHWYGGYPSPDTFAGGNITYDGYGIDCSGLVSCGARWAGYNWSSWHQTTGGLENVASEITEANVVPGNILNKSGSHVRTIYDVYVDNGIRYVSMIAAEGGNTSKVVYVDNKILSSEIEAGYVPRHLDYTEP